MAESDSRTMLTRKPSPKDLIECHKLFTDKWYILGVGLGLDQDELEMIEDKYGDDELRMMKMFRLWLKTDSDPTYSTLIKTLIVIGKKEAAESLCQHIGELQYCVVIS